MEDIQWKTCTRKVRLYTKEKARAYIRKHYGFPHRFKIYPCSYGDHWHVARKKVEAVRELVLDFETASAAELKECGAHRYSEDVTTEVLCLGTVFEGETSNWVPGESTDRLASLAADPTVLFVAHNAGFEKAIWRNIMVPLYGLPDVPNYRWDDTLAMCAMRAIPLDLDRATLALRLSVNKDKEGSTFTKRLSKPNRKGYYDRSPEALARVYRYCQQDIIVERDLRQRLGPMPKGERNVWLLDQRINGRGVLLDLALIEKAQEVVDRASIPLIEEFKNLTGGLSPTQTVKFKAWVEDQGVYMDSLNKEAVAAILREENEDGEIEMYEESVQLPPLVKRALFIRSLVGSASIKKLARMRKCINDDGRARGLLQYHGASPGRWAGRLLQPQNFPRGTLRDAHGNVPEPDFVVRTIMSGDPETVEMLLGPPIESVVSALRHTIIAAPGRTLLSGDFAGVEARLVLAASGQHDKTELMATGKDVYCDMAQEIYKRPIDKKKDPEERQTGKNSVLGLGFGMGWRKFKMKYGQKLSEDFCSEIVKTYREDWAPCVPKMWYALEEAALETVRNNRPHEAYGVIYQIEDKWLTARLPSGRKLWYFNPHKVSRVMPWDDKVVRVGWAYQQMKTGQFKTIDAFGGLLCENVIQALARDLMVHAMFKLEKNGFPIILTVHDEIVCEPLAEDADQKAFEQIMLDSPAWANEMKMPVAVETCKDTG
jgi:DNA polymerase